MDDGLALVGVIGAGTMGAGIAQVAAVAGHRVLLADAVDGAAGRAVDRIRERVKAQVAKGRLDADPDALDITATEISEMGAAGVVVEAVVEDLGVKRRLFAELEELVSADCLLASNSSSLTPTAMAAGLAHPERLVGLHFFNPVPVMQLVEVISGLATAAWAADRAEALAQAWGKTVVRSAATPGFIVNRIARPFYAEAWRLQEEHAAVPEVIDAVLTGAGGFRMGPFALMDLIGHDVNESVTRSVWASFANDPRFAPSLGQRRGIPRVVAEPGPHRPGHRLVHIVADQVHQRERAHAETTAAGQHRVDHRWLGGALRIQPPGFTVEGAGYPVDDEARCGGRTDDSFAP